jgi:hypothetical protein
LNREMPPLLSDIDPIGRECNRKTFAKVDFKARPIDYPIIRRCL